MGDQGRRGNGGGLHEREVPGLRRELVLPHRRILRVRTAVAPLIPSDDLAEHLITRFEPRHARADRLDAPGEVDPRHGVLRCAEAATHEAQHVGHASHGMPHVGMERGRVHADQYLAVPDRRPVDLPELQDVVGIAVRGLDDRLHRSLLPVPGPSIIDPVVLRPPLATLA